MREQVLLGLRAFDEPSTIGVAVHRDRVESCVLVVLVDVSPPVPEAPLEHAIPEHPNVAPLVHRARNDARPMARTLHHERGFERLFDGDVDTLPTRLATVLKHEHRIVWGCAA